ncbi:general secretion pathway protein GspD [Anatilimnocola floriformis]|uniref:general secretion pathway protein GspD n=1 Tax=Anatilimnocola floriformis TaxID=2948575 RepID=UPI0020C4DB06|nr:general secretion pathway protein GspD [Anatilimnocola floriformis]
MKASVVLPSIVVLSTLLVASSQAATPTAVAWIIAADAVGQAPAADPRRQSDDLLRQARKALKDGQFDRADGLIVEAEKLGVKYDPVWDKFADTPAVLKKLAAEERAKGKGGIAKPSSLFPAFMQPGDKQPAPPSQPPADPFAARNARENTVDKITNGSMPQNNPTAPFVMSPTEMAAKDQQGVPLLPNGAGPPGFANGQATGAPNPYALPQEANPLARNPEMSNAPPVAFNPPSFGPAPSAPAGPQPGMPGTADQFAGMNMPAAREAGRPDEAPQRLPTPPFTPAPTNTPEKKAEALRLVAEARMALDKGDLNKASQLAKQADGLRVPDSMFAQNETRPWQVMLEVDKAIYRNQGVQAAGGIQGPGDPKFPVQPGVFNQGNAEPSRIQPAAAVSANLMRQNPEAIGGSHPMRLYDEGVKALEAQDRDTAMRKFTEAWKSADQLDPELRAALKDKLTFLRAANAPAQPLPRPDGPASPIQPQQTSPSLEAAGSQQEVARQRLQREFSNETKAAEQIAQKDPKAALAKIKAFRERVVSAEIDTNARKNLLTLVDRRASELQTYIDNNKSSIENAEKNRAVLAGRAREQELTYEMQDKLASLVEQFNKLMDDRRYAEALVIAKQAKELAPNDPVTVSLIEKGALAVGIAQSESTRRNKEEAFRQQLQDVDDAGYANVNDADPIVFNARRWGELTRRRRGLLESRNRMSPAEQEIQKSLGKPVEVKFVNRPLNEVVNVLSQMTGVNIYLDPQGLHAEGVTVDTPVTLDLSQPISLKSALNLLLEPLGMSYVIQNEVLRVTSQHMRDSNVYAKVYYVADLVIPIPNFTPTYNMGIAGALKESLSTLGYGGNGSPLGRAPLTVAKNDPMQNNSINPTQAGHQHYLAQQGMSEGNGLFPTATSRNPATPGGPGGMGGGVQADFDPLIDLITSTIEPDSWQDVGGPGSVSGFDTNLSLVVSQRQDIHERIADLLEQLRRLQDLQVTIEVRFITVSDRFFERIGIDFDFNIDDNTHLNRFADQIPTPTQSQPLSPFDDDFKSFAVGLTPTGPTADLDYRFSQGGFVTAVPQFGGFDAGSAANFGFAILSDIEVFFLLQAAQGDDRTNVLQAPKVTLFNGQQATIIDSSFRPFVTSVIPVVGDFAAAHQPVIVVLSEGTMMSVQAVVSADRRFVRLTLVPFFSQIGDVETFTFTGSVTTNSGTVIQDPSNPDQNAVSGATRTVSGTTVQLPTLATTTVTTTVSVPDGGTVLLGGIKRLREGRTERGLPLVSKIPYVSRLFTNVGIGRDAQSLMMMVTPRIIIQEEEEEKLGIDFEDPGK